MNPFPYPILFDVVPLGKPRMTQRDKWKKRPPVIRYHAFKDKCRKIVDRTPGLRDCLASGSVVDVSWVAYLPIPKSWSKKKKAEMAGRIHRAKPDRDNIDKAILDTLFIEDSGIGCGILTKRWDDGQGPRLEITLDEESEELALK